MDLQSVENRWNEFVDAVVKAIRNHTAANSNLLEGENISQIRQQTMSDVANLYYDIGQTEDYIENIIVNTEHSVLAAQGKTSVYEGQKEKIDGIYDSDEHICQIAQIDNDDNIVLLFGSKAHLAKSTDKLESISGYSPPFSDKPTALASRNSLLVVGTESGDLYLTSDAAESWETPALLIGGSTHQINVEILKIGIDNEDRWFILTKDELLRGSSTGWQSNELVVEQLVLPAVSELYDLAVGISDEYYLVTDAGVFVSYDYGQSWSYVDTSIEVETTLFHQSRNSSQIVTDIDSNVAIRRGSDSRWFIRDLDSNIVQIDSSTDGFVMAITDDYRLVRSIDDGYRWRQLHLEENFSYVFRGSDFWFVSQEDGNYYISRDI